MVTLLLRVGAAPETDAARSESPLPLLTAPGQIWALSAEMKMVAHRIRFEGRVNYVDPTRNWQLLWLEQDGVSSFVRLSPSAPSMRAGQRVLIEGTLVPQEGLTADRVTVQVLRDYEPIAPTDIEGRVWDVDRLTAHIVTTKAFVLSQRLDADYHLKLSLIVDNQPAEGFVLLDAPRTVPNWQGNFVQIVGLYGGIFDPTRTKYFLSLWVAHQQDVTVLGTIAESPRFHAPLAPINGIYRFPLGQDVRIRGQVQSQVNGSQLVLRDETGQVAVHSAQRESMRLDSEVEAVGRTAFSGGQWTLESALFRPAGGTDRVGGATASAGAPLPSIGQLRTLGREDAMKARPVSLRGTVTWSRPDAHFFFFADLTGAIRVHYRPGQLEDWMETARDINLQITGVTRDEGFAPSVDLTGFQLLGSMGAPTTKEISYQEAIAGDKDGQAVEMRGFLQRAERDGDNGILHLTTPDGDFVAHFPFPFDCTPAAGDLIRVSGICEVSAGDNGRITGFALHSASPTGVTIDEKAPADLFETPVRSIASLRRMKRDSDFTRVCITATVLASVPGFNVSVQEGNSGLLLLTRQKEPLAQGDRIEAVGILGWDGVGTVLRETHYRKIGTGEVPAASPLDDPSGIAMELDSRLVRVRGTLIGALRQPNKTRLTLQSGRTIFDAILGFDIMSANPGVLELGAGLELTGIYRVVLDETRQTRAFQLQVHAPVDITVFQTAPVWTIRRALTGAGILGGCSVIGLAWIAALRHRVRRQTRQIAKQLQRQAQLEAQVERAARIESLGVLAGGIAHDFNNLLTVVQGNVSLLLHEEKVTDAATECLWEIQKGAERAKGLTQQLLTFATGGDPVRAAIALPLVLRDAAESALRGTKVRCEFDFAPAPWFANVDRDQIYQAIGNLVRRGAQAMPTGGVVRLAMSNEVVSENARPALAAGHYLRISVADSGDSIPEAVLPRIFDPYFSTTKDGDGLCLATVYSIVKKHAGAIEVDSRAGQGTTFMLWLPAGTDRPAEGAVAPEANAPAACPPNTAARALLMDDEPSIRRLGTVLMGRMGMEVVAVGDGAEALREFSAARDAGRPFGLVILDLTIPGGMGGKETIERIRELDPAVPAIVSSGYSRDPILAHFQDYGFQASVPKPYDVRKFAETITRLLASRQ